MLTLASVATLFVLLCICPVALCADLDKPLAFYRANNMERALPLFEQIVADNADNVEARVWLAETYRRLGMMDEAVSTAGKALELEPCNSFAHTVIADACRRPPGDAELLDSDTTWVRLNNAVQCDSTDGNAWMGMYCEAILREKFEVMRTSVRMMKDTGFLTGAALAYGRWMLRTLPENTVLITNGDMDTFPLLAVQLTEGLRPDVVVIEHGLLNTTQFLRFVRDHCGVPLPVQDSQLESLTEPEDSGDNAHSVSERIFRGWLDQKRSGSFTRPIAVAVTVDKSFLLGVEEHLQYAGPFLLWQPTPDGETPDTASLGASLAALRPEDFSGPWVSERDRSPVRTLYTKRLAMNVTKAALVYSEELIRAKEFNDAVKILDWADDFEKTTDLGSVFTERISQLRDAAREVGQSP